MPNGNPLAYLAQLLQPQEKQPLPAGLQPAPTPLLETQYETRGKSGKGEVAARVPAWYASTKNPDVVIEERKPKVPYRVVDQQGNPAIPRVTMGHATGEAAPRGALTALYGDHAQAASLAARLLGR